jgi:hypothetical protein
MVNWIMGCVRPIYFDVLIHGSTSRFFNPFKELRQSFPISHILFLIVIEGLSITIRDAIIQW